jgi:hypothetical protein
MKMCQIFVGWKSLVIDVFGMHNNAEFVNTLEDVIRKRGAMDKLISDSAKVEISKRVLDILRALCINDWQSEPQYQHQNYAERRWGTLKMNVEWYMNWRNVQANAWLLCTEWCADVMNVTAEKSIGWRTPLEVLTGETTDINIALCFLFWDVVYVKRYKNKHYQGQVGSDESSEIRGRFVGFSKNVGHALTFKILTDDTQKIIHRSQVRLASVGENNLKLNMAAGAVPEQIYIRSKRDHTDPNVVLPTINAFASPFVSDKEELEANKASAKSPGESHSAPAESTNVATSSPLVETINNDEDDDPEEDDPPPMMTRPADDESSVDSNDDEYQRCNWWTGEHDDDYRSPMDNTPFKDMPCVEVFEPNYLKAPHTREDQDKFAFD